MNLPLKNNQFIKRIVILVVCLLSVTIAAWSIAERFLSPERIWAWNFYLLDIFYERAVRQGYGPTVSSRIVYVPITDESYDYFGKSFLDRADVARLNNVLAHYHPEAVAHDIIYARPGDPYTDQFFTASIKNLGVVYLPIGIGFTEKTQAFKFQWGEGTAYERLRTDYLKTPTEKGTPRPFSATHALMQKDEFAEVAFNAGHITVESDLDGVYRHIILLFKVDARYFPALSLAMFLDYVQVPFEKVLVNWGHDITIPATSDSVLERDVIIPIDTRGRAFVPYARAWPHDFKRVAAHTLLQLHENENLHGNLTEFFEGKFVFIGDVATGLADAGPTPLDNDAPLITIHTAVLNGLLTNTFYRQWASWQTVSCLGILSLLLGLSALPRASWPLHAMGGALLLGIIGLTWHQLTHFSLFPIVTVMASSLFISFGLVIGIQVHISKDQAFIRNAFSKYVPETVVNDLLAHPEQLQLGGEERVLSVLFSDVESFTTIAENMSPAALVSLLNEYLTEMTTIILAHGGIIDKYEGDAIMAEFGAPLPLPNHAEQAVRAALAMQQRLRELRPQWAKRGLPALRCRVGITTGPMIIGNMGSNQVFDYTVIGDAVNLASRLESANKFYHTLVMISEDTHACLAPETFRTRALDVIKVKGKSRAVKVFEVYGETCAPIAAQDLQYYQTYHEAFTIYLRRNFLAAQAQFAVALALRPNDPAAQVMLDRIEDLTIDDLPDDWDGSIALTSK